LLGSDIFQHTEDFYLKLLDAVAQEHGSADTAQARRDIFQRKEGGLSMQSGSQGENRWDNKARHRSYSSVVGNHS